MVRLYQREIAVTHQTNKVHIDAVSTAALHPSAIVLSTCSGQRHFSPEPDTLGSNSSEGNESDSESESDSDSEKSLGDSISVESPCSKEEPGHPWSKGAFDNSLAIWAL